MSVGVWYATGEEQRNSSKKKEEAKPKQKQPLVVDVSGGESKVRWPKEQYCIGTWKVGSINQGKLNVVKQEMARVKTDIFGINELNGWEWENLIQTTILFTTVGKNPLEETK